MCTIFRSRQLGMADRMPFGAACNDAAKQVTLPIKAPTSSSPCPTASTPDRRSNRHGTMRHCLTTDSEQNPTCELHHAAHRAGEAADRAAEEEAAGGAREAAQRAGVRIPAALPGGAGGLRRRQRLRAGRQVAAGILHSSITMTVHQIPRAAELVRGRLQQLTVCRTSS